LRLIDSHCHLQAAPFADDVAEVLASARAAGVARILVPGYDVASSITARVMAIGGEVDASAGIHPHVASAVDDEAWAAIEDLARSPAVVALGETGLDYDREFSPREAQLANVRRHLTLGAALGKPVILHCRSKAGARDAQDDLLRELEAAGRPLALLHSFSGPVDYAERALEMGLAISFSGLVFRKGEEQSAEVTRLVPDDRLLVETDSPYLSAPGAPKRRNEPRYVSVTATWLAQQRGADPDELGETLVATYDRVFNRPRNSSRPSASSR
jgi:TatD DNase family protein